MYGTAKFQVTAQTDCQVMQTPFLTVNRHQVCQCLCWMLVTAVACINNGDFGKMGCPARRALFRMPHSTDICEAGHHTNGIGNAFPFRRG